MHIEEWWCCLLVETGSASHRMIAWHTLNRKCNYEPIAYYHGSRVEKDLRVGGRKGMGRWGAHGGVVDYDSNFGLPQFHMTTTRTQ